MRRSASAGRETGRPPYLVARAAGISLDDVVAMSARRYSGWLDHLSRFPVGGRNVEILLATTCALLYNLGRGKDESPKFAGDYAPWLGLSKGVRASPVPSKDDLDLERVKELSRQASQAALPGDEDAG